MNIENKTQSAVLLGQSPVSIAALHAEVDKHARDVTIICGQEIHDSLHGDVVELLPGEFLVSKGQLQDLDTSPVDSVIVYGPQGCGKTLNADALRRAFGLSVVYDGEIPPDIKKIPRHGVLILTCDEASARAYDGRMQVINFNEAMKRVGQGAA